jgi:predicted GNAT family N-acyltransferase
MTIELIKEEGDLLKRGIEYFWKHWGSDSNFNFYKNCINNSIFNKKSVPKFYLLLNDTEIIGCYAILTNDIISRQDLMPWFACLYIEKDFRNQGLADKLLKHSLQEAKKLGFDTLYLSTELKDFYEKKGWQYFSNGYGFFGDELKLYSIKTNELK